MDGLVTVHKADLKSWERFHLHHYRAGGVRNLHINAVGNILAVRLDQREFKLHRGAISVHVYLFPLCS